MNTKVLNNVSYLSFFEVKSIQSNEFLSVDKQNKFWVKNVGVNPLHLLTFSSFWIIERYDGAQISIIKLIKQLWNSLLIKHIQLIFHEVDEWKLDLAYLFSNL